MLKLNNNQSMFAAALVLFAATLANAQPFAFNAATLQQQASRQFSLRHSA